MKVFGVWAAMILAIIVVLWLVMAGTRWFNQTATTIDVRSIDDHVDCALATSQDGVAIDCWVTDDADP